MSTKERPAKPVTKKELSLERRDYFFPPHGGRPPTDEAIRKATQRYIDEEKKENT